MAAWEELTALRPGVALRYDGAEFVIERCIRYDERGCVWFEHRLSSDGSGRSLWLEIPPKAGEPVIAYETSATLEAAPDGGPEIEHRGERMPLIMSGRAQYRTIERSAAAKTGELVYHEYGVDDRRVTYECRGDEAVWEVSEGRAIEGAAIEILA
jgi:hypothetical protein